MRRKRMFSRWAVLFLVAWPMLMVATFFEELWRGVSATIREIIFQLRLEHDGVVSQWQADKRQAND